MHNATLTISLALSAGVLLVVAARRFNLPSIVLLLLGGIVLGPEALGVVDPASLDEGLDTVISLAVAIILFEGGLTLDLVGYRSAATSIRRLLTWGVLITWLGAAAAAHLLYGLPPGLALMAGSLVIVTGPTVVLPILRRLRVRDRLHHLLYWEGVLIDVVGVFIALLCYEMLAPDVAHQPLDPLMEFAFRLIVGGALGIATGQAILVSLRRDWIDGDQVNIFVLACAMLSYALANALVSESGLLVVVVAGLYVGLHKPHQLKTLKQFKLQLTELGIGTVFILLAATLDLSAFTGWRLALYLAVVMLLLRPLGVWVSTIGQGFDARERLFLSWLAPRGIVAAAMASLFSLRLQSAGVADAIHLQTLTYAVIGATVTLQGLSAPAVVRLLGLERRDRRTWALVGDDLLVQELSRALQHAGVPVIELPDVADRDAEIDPTAPRFADVAALLCADVTMLRNVMASVRWSQLLTPKACYRWATFEPDEEVRARKAPGRAVWRSSVSAVAVRAGLEDGHYAIDVVDMADGIDGRFDEDVQPLFWVKAGRAILIEDPLQPGAPEGELVVVLRRRVPGLKNLIRHIELVDESAVDLETILGRLWASCERLMPDIELEGGLAGILDRARSMPVAVGGGIAIPHAYCRGTDRSICLLAVVPRGVEGLLAPDDEPVRLVFLLLSPAGRAGQHLKSLAALATIGQQRHLVDLICRLRVPQRIAKLLEERS